jgi:hypothetical protein
MEIEVTEENQSSDEGTVNWAAAEAFLTGRDAEAADPEGDGEGADDTTQNEPEFVEVSVKGRKIKMAPADAAAFEDFRREVRERDGRLGGENAQLKERLARIEGMLEAQAKREEKPAIPDVTPPDPRLAETDFAEWQRQNTIYHAAMMQKMAAELRAEYDKDKAAITSDLKNQSAKEREERESKQWAEQFYGTYTHLNKPNLRAIVQGVYNSNAQEINAAGSTVEQQKLLATKVEQAVMELTMTGKEINRNNKPPRVEGAGAPRSKEQPKPVEVVTGASWQAKRRALMRGAA